MQFLGLYFDAGVVFATSHSLLINSFIYDDLLLMFDKQKNMNLCDVFFWNFLALISVLQEKKFQQILIKFNKILEIFPEQREAVQLCLFAVI